MPGAAAFLCECRLRAATVSIISHKTVHAARGRREVNLRDAAIAWMHEQGFFDPRKFGLSPSDVFFAASRREKLERIRTAGCDYFIDDLEEVLLDPDFPEGVRRVLFSSQPSAGGPAGFASWHDIVIYIFGGDASGPTPDMHQA